MEIPLTKNMFALIDAIDFVRVGLHVWHVTESSHSYYAATWTGENGTRKKVYLHRFIVDCPSSHEVHHIDGNTLNNCRKNLIICDRATNLSYRNFGGEK